MVLAMETNQAISQFQLSLERQCLKKISVEDKNLTWVVAIPYFAPFSYPYSPLLRNTPFLALLPQTEVEGHFQCFHIHEVDGIQSQEKYTWKILDC